MGENSNPCILERDGNKCLCFGGWGGGGGKLPSSRQENFKNMKTIKTRDIKCWGS